MVALYHGLYQALPGLIQRADLTPPGLTGGVLPTELDQEMKEAIWTWEAERAKNLGEKLPAKPGQIRKELDEKWKMEPPPPPSPRDLPDVRFSEVEEGWGGVVAAGWDTLVESFNMAITEADYASLDFLKSLAADLGGEGRQDLNWGGEELQMWGYGAKGSRGLRFWIANDDFAIGIRAPGMAWPVSVRYSAAGLWEHGVEALRERAKVALLSQFQPVGPTEADWSRVSEAHWATDVWSEAMTDEMRSTIVDQVIAPSMSKKMCDLDKSEPIKTHSRGRRLETLTIALKGLCQVQVYDKCREITDKSGKTWMIDLWARDGGFEPGPDGPSDVWRVEVRMWSDWLRKRGVVTVADLLEHRRALVTEALLKRRLVSVDEGDGNRWRWPIHPLWVVVLNHLQRTEKALPIGEQVTGAGEAIEEALMKQMAGLARACSVLRVGDWDDVYLVRLVDELREIMKKDQSHDKKILCAQARYKYVHCAH